MGTFISDRAEAYKAPRIHELGLVTAATLGHGGSSLDGNCKIDQRGSGNDGTGPHKNGKCD